MTELNRKQILDFPGGSVVKNLTANTEMLVQPLGQKDPLENEMATLSSILAWEITCTEGSGRPHGEKSWTQLSD